MDRGDLQLLSGGSNGTNELVLEGPMLHTLEGDGGSFEIDWMSGPALDQVLEHTCLPRPEAGLSGTLQLQLRFTALQQQHAAAVMIQAAWRGHHVRVLQYEKVSPVGCLPSLMGMAPCSH
jgi:hypothetical protein